MKAHSKLMRRLSSFLRGERGTQLVELAIVLPLFVLMFAAIAEFGRFFYTYTTLAKATRVGARCCPDCTTTISMSARPPPRSTQSRSHPPRSAPKGSSRPYWPRRHPPPTAGSARSAITTRLQASCTASNSTSLCHIPRCASSTFTMW